ncbi:phosphoserine phosphatase [Coccinella septempunctata]|uniref:phosphoserine phosphatase n=1 Tax=Coccinella septempunctata TaxID=41139 RepID=UPI001D081F7F|nr:phosphoserine phosphatase [Coccinella septempunctata]
MDKVKEVLRKADAVCFDVDSTVIKEEGIDELAKFCGKGKEIAELTNKAMGGSMTFQESLNLRMNILQPSVTKIKEFLNRNPANLSPGIKEVVDTLRRRNVEVYLVTGGFRCIVSPIARQLDIPETNIYSNRMKFYFDGEYAGFDENQPTSRSGGKAEVVRILKEKFGYKNLVMIGDGATDLEACPPADAFIGYGGNVVREGVKRNAKWFVEDFQEVIDALK